jgi:trimethylamine--corrinoid protein Co-methyltransferase
MSGTRLSIWGDDECRRGHEATLAVLDDPGAEVQDPRARELLAGAGAHVDGTRVRIPAKLVDAALTSAPHSFAVKSRGEHEPLAMEQGRTWFGTGGDCLYTRDLESGERRRARQADIYELAVLSERLDNIDFVMSMAMGEDAPAQGIGPAEFAALLKGTRKPLIVDQVWDSRELAVLRRMAALAGEADSFVVYAMSSSPLIHSEGALDRVMTCAELGIPVIYGAGACAGFTVPASRSALVVDSNAEVLGGLVIHQLTSPGAPFIFGATAPAMSMRTTSIVYTGPESMAMQQVLCDLGRFYGLPTWTIGAASDSKTLDGQWAAEAAASLTLAALTGGTLVHDVGYFESGLQSSHESVVFGDELIGYLRAYHRGVPLDDIDTAVAEIRAVGPAGDHLGRPYTRKHFREFWQTSLLDQWVHEHWAADGSRSLLERLTARALELHSRPTPFELPSDVPDRLDDMAARAADGAFVATA